MPHTLYPHTTPQDDFRAGLEEYFPFAGNTFIDRFLEYLDTSRERDDSILGELSALLRNSPGAALTEEPYHDASDHGFYNESSLETALFNNAVANENEELLNRFILAAQAVNPCGFCEMANPVIFRHGSEPVRRALALRYGDNADAALCAGLVLRSDFNTEVFSPECFARAMYFCKPTDIMHIFALCAHAFNAAQQQGLPDYLKGAHDMLLRYRFNLDVENGKQLYSFAALVFGAYHSEQLYRILRDVMISSRDTAERLYRALNLISVLNLPVTKAALMAESAYDKPDEMFINNIVLVTDAGERGELLKNLAVKNKEAYANVMIQQLKPETGIEMEKVFLSVYPGHKSVIRERVRTKCISAILKGFAAGGSDIRDYLLGNTSAEEILPLLENIPPFSYAFDRGISCDYCAVFGEDDFFRRCCTVCMCSQLRNTGILRITMGSSAYESPGNMLRILLDAGVPVHNAFDAVDKCMFLTTASPAEWTAEKLKGHIKAIASCDPKKINIWGRQVYISLLSLDADRYKERLFILSDDPSPQVSSQLSGVLTDKREWRQDIAELLKSESVPSRRLALTVIKGQGAHMYHRELEAALEAEKNESLRLLIYEILGKDIPPEQLSRMLSDRISELSRSSRHSWLFKTPLSPVHDKAGNTVDKKTLKAFLSCFIDYNESNIKTQEFIAGSLDEADLRRFCDEVLGKWLENGAQPLTSWVLYLCASRGGEAAAENILKCIGKWSGEKRNFLIREAMKALAWADRPETITGICAAAAGSKRYNTRLNAREIIINHAEKKDITVSRLLDEAVPDMGFDKRMCRTLDYGRRCFEVYILPDQKLEIISGGKKIKALPRPGARDDADKARCAYEAFAGMKKQIKAITTVQSRRLEEALIHDIRRPADKWRELFIKNPFMHIFASGLVWGIYEGNEGNEGNESDELKETFRYLDDGSFIDIQGDEFLFPENAVVGLVHPAELDESGIKAWKDQLSDFETVQPVRQLDRQVYRIRPEEINSRSITRFSGVSMDGSTFCGAMHGKGWHMDGIQPQSGRFGSYNRVYPFTDKRADSYGKLPGLFVQLVCSGSYCYNYYNDNVDNVTVGELIIRRNGSEGSILTPGQAGKRFFSELMLELGFIDAQS